MDTYRQIQLIGHEHEKLLNFQKKIWECAAAFTDKSEKYQKMIKLTNNGPHVYIEKASGPRATAGNLEEGAYYLHYNHAWMRKIEYLTDKDVHYTEQGGYIWHTRISVCTRSTFVHPCPTKATDEEIKFLMEKAEII